MKSTTQRNTIYSAGFTSGTGALFHREINALLPFLLSENAGEQLKQEVSQNNVLLINSEKTRKTAVRQINSRIKFAFPGFWGKYTSSSYEEQALMLFYLAISAIAVVYDFHVSVTIPAWKGSSRTFDWFNYQMRLDQLGDQNPVVDKWTPGTRYQIVKIYKRMLKEAGFLQDDKLIQPRKVDEFFLPFLKNKQAWFLEACFLSQADIERINNLYAKQV